MIWLLWGLGLVLVIEGLAFALAPSRLEDLLRALADLPVAARRWLGVGAMTLGLGLIWVARSWGF